MAIPKVSIIIVQYQSGNSLHQCLNSINTHTTDVDYEIILVDNENSPLLKEQLEGQSRISLLNTGANLGYGAGNNYGVNHAAGKYVLILNPDVELQTNVVKELSDYLDGNQRVAAVAPTLVNASGERDKLQGSRRLTMSSYLMSHTIIHCLWPGNPVARKHYLLDADHSVPMSVGALVGSVFMIDKKMFIQAGKFDERMFLFFEEYDLGRRIQNLTKQLMILPHSLAIHHHHPETQSSLKKYYTKSRSIYFTKYYGKIGNFLFTILLTLLNWRTWLVVVGLGVLAILGRQML